MELFNNIPTGRTYHQYINPARDIPQDAIDVHGLTNEILENKPRFEAVADDFLDFIGDSKLVIHNASFDMRFLNAELEWCSKPQIPFDRAIDTLAMARKKFPGSPASLDALCRRFAITGFDREKHGALLDSQILAEVYLHLIGGRQKHLSLQADAKARTTSPDPQDTWHPMPRPKKLASSLSEKEKADHDAFIADFPQKSLWSDMT